MSMNGPKAGQRGREHARDTIANCADDLARLRAALAEAEAGAGAEDEEDDYDRAYQTTLKAAITNTERRQGQ